MESYPPLRASEAPRRPGHVQPLDRPRRWRVIRPCPHARTPAWPGGGPWGLALAQSGRAPGCSPGGCWFESSRSDPFWVSALGSEPSQCNGGQSLIRHCEALQPPGTCGNFPTGIQSLDRIPGSNPQRAKGSRMHRGCQSREPPGTCAKF